jgi:hypothetical protein
MTLGNAAAARVRLIVWCKDCRHQVEPDRSRCRDGSGSCARWPSLLEEKDRILPISDLGAPRFKSLTVRADCRSGARNWREIYGLLIPMDVQIG